MKTRTFIYALLTTLLLGQAAQTFAQPLSIARLRYEGGDWYCDPGSLANLQQEFRRRTGLVTANDPVVVDMESENLYGYPLLYLSGHGKIQMNPDQIDELRRYLDAGGFLWADDNYGLDVSFRALVAQLFPEAELRRLGSDHPIYHSYYDLAGLPKIHEHDGDPAQGFGVEKDGRLMIFYSWSSDIGDGLEDPEVHGDRPEVREAAFRMGINVLMYALTHP